MIHHQALYADNGFACFLFVINPRISVYNLSDCRRVCGPCLYYYFDKTVVILI